MSDDLGSGDPLLGVLHQQLGDQVLGLNRDGGPLGLGELKITILQQNKSFQRLEIDNTLILSKRFL